MRKKCFSNLQVETFKLHGDLIQESRLMTGNEEFNDINLLWIGLFGAVRFL